VERPPAICRTSAVSTYIFASYPSAKLRKSPFWVRLVVKKILGYRGVGEPIPDCEIESVRAPLDRGGFQNHPLNIGQHARIRGGTSTAWRVAAKDQDLSLIVSITVIQRSPAIPLTGYQIEAA
jgi:hypothetical protein